MCHPNDCFFRDVPEIHDDPFHPNMKRNAVFNSIKLSEAGRSSISNFSSLDMSYEVNRLRLDMKNAVVDNYEKFFQVVDMHIFVLR